MKRSILAITFLLWLAHFSYAQCPNYSTVNYFDTTCYRYLPTELKVGQGHIGHADLWGTTGARSFDFYIPNGREGWAIAIVHQWQVMRNILKYNTDVFNWHSQIGTLFKESFGACDPNLNFTGITRCDGSALQNPFINLDNYTIHAANPSGPARVDGCFQIDHNTGWPIYPKYYPWRWTNPAQHTTYMAQANFETAALSKMYYELAFMRMMEYVKGYDTEGVFTGTGEKSAATMFVAMAYNKGFNGTPENIFTTAGNRATAIATNDWLNNLTFETPDINYDYTRAVTHVTKVLSNNYEGGWTRTWNGVGWTATADNAWHCWYDKQITWAMMTTYMNKFFPLYPEVNAATVTAKVQAVFNSINGGGPVSFRYQLAPVIDEFILNMPYDDPMQSWLYSTDGISGCAKGSPACIGPPTTLKANGPTTVCSGLSVELETITGTGYTYQWTRNGTNISNPNSVPYIYYATQSGTYSVKITNSTGCTVESDCQIAVTVNNCSSCSMTATASSSANSCSGVQNGSVSVSLTNAPGGGVTYNWTGPVSGNTATLSNVPDGTYIVEVVSVTTPTCKAYATVKVIPTTVIYQAINLNATTVNCSTVDLNATVVNNPPATCNYRLTVTYNVGGCYGFWDNSQLQLILSANNTTLSTPAITGNGGASCTHFDQTFSVPNGVPLKVTLKRIAASTVNGPNFTFRLYNSAGTQIWTQNINGVAFTQTLNDLTTVTTNCNVAMPTFTMSWSPTTELTNITNGTNTTSARAVVTTDRTYTVFAQHPTLSQCNMSKSIFVDYTCPGGLPVEWLSFAASVKEDRTVLLNWATATEINTDKFVIERSKDGLNFTEIGYVSASGNHNGYKEYSYIDGNPLGGTSFYRLKEIDIDGSAHYSAIEMVSLNSDGTFRIYPNPSQQHFYIEGSTSEQTYLRLTDLTGKTILEKTIEIQPEQAHLIDDNSLPSGVYILIVRNDAGEHVFKLVKN